jgi:hypothetical protein
MSGVISRRFSLFSLGVLGEGLAPVAFVFAVTAGSMRGEDATGAKGRQERQKNESRRNFRRRKFLRTFMGDAKKESLPAGAPSFSLLAS